MADIIFSKIIDGEIPSEKIYEDESHLAFLSINPFEKGHTLVIPKKGYSNIFEIPQDEFLNLCKVVYKISQHFRKVLNCDLNIWSNNGEISGQEIEHVHFHIVPRKDNKKTYALENIEIYMDGEMRNYAEYLRLK